MDLINEEFITNYLAFLALTKAFLPFLQAKTTESSLIYTTSALALVPMPRCPNYCASKAALHHFILVLRKQLKGSKIKVIEIFPPAVQTELHDEKHQPDIKNGGSIGMPLDEFTDEAYQGLVDGLDQVAVGMSKMCFDAFENKRQEMFNRF
jgi:short-subunit dehydrogenase involved in D-alanine esterification of teichoic acids